MVIQLREVISSAAESSVFDLINNFSCLDNDVENFIKTKAYQHEQRNKSRTYLVISKDKQKLLAYYTLSLKTLEFTEHVSKTTIKSIDGFNKNANSTPVILIGQFGKDKNNTKYISGTELLNICLSHVYAIHNYVGGRIVLLESINNEKVLNFYKRNGFSIFREDINGEFIQMIRAL